MKFPGRLLIPLLPLLPAAAQLDLPDYTPEEASPSSSPVPQVDEQAVKEMTRSIQSGGLALTPPPEIRDPRAERVAENARRYRQGPDRVEVRVALSPNGGVAGTMANTTFLLENRVGRFPLRWGEVSRVEPAGDGFRFLLVGGDRLTGRPLVDALRVERPDGGIQMVPVSDWVRIDLRSQGT